ncbi:probable serine/threonine-protein kinase cdc7 [Anopheles nili]|uniref:probable serine/threonine-protein kinase cdc7 n=1 Tax=Anopheles nili TaxID=185578 RepID=UPI00237BB32F|nr:probable serine/threonine-protein kinase cdc7 [Anopheles nili]
MSHSPPSYMDGVPVKISERFKPPPKIVLPQGVVNRLSQYDVVQVMNESCYDGELEDTVLKRITEWKAIKERERYERKARLQAKEQERVRLVEAEQKRKLNQISYPNTDELSSASDDNDEGISTARVANGSEDEYEEDNDESGPSGSSDERANLKPFDHMSQLSSILVPTVIREAVPSAVDAPAYPDVPMNANIIPKTAQVETARPMNASFGSNNNNNNNNNYNKINYSDFENDTSSPFDNMELRTINDLDILAQVLKQNITLTSPETDAEKNDTKNWQSQDPDKQRESEEKKQAPLPGATAHSSTVAPSEQQQLQQQQLPAPSNPVPLSTNPYNSAYSTNQQYSMYATQYPHSAQTTIVPSGGNDYLSSSYNTYQPYANYGAQYDTVAATASSFSSANVGETRYPMGNYTSPTYHVPPASQTHQASYPSVASNYAYGYQQQHSYVTAPSTSMASGTGTSTYTPNYGYNTTTTSAAAPSVYGAGFARENYQSLHAVSTPGATATANPSVYTTAAEHSVAGFDAAAGLKSKSRSVPDIMRQLNDEVQDSVTRRTRNNSQTISDRQTTSLRGQDTVPNITDEKRVDYTKYNQLSQADQNVVKRINSMGFPLERVVWVLQRIGNDDKKIIEHLIPLSELLDLGFEGEKISDALLKFGNNKHKALDFLIS